jgi:hypothetical protein
MSPKVYMKWTKLRTQLTALICPMLRDRIALHQARYRYTRSESGRVWLTLDKRQIVSFDTDKYIARSHELEKALGESATHAGELVYGPSRGPVYEQLRASGEYDDYAARGELESYLNMPLEEALTSPSPLIRALAVVDRRLGKRRLRALRMEDEHPLVRTLYVARCEAEGIRRSLEERQNG